MEHPGAFKHMDLRGGGPRWKRAYVSIEECLPPPPLELHPYH